MKPGFSGQRIPGARPRAAAKCVLCDTRLASDKKFPVGTTDFRAATRCCQECAGLFGVFLEALLETAKITPVPSHRYVSARFIPSIHEYSR